MSVLSYSPSAGCLDGWNLEYVVVANRYILFEDFGPFISFWDTLPTFFLVFMWPVAIGIVSFFYCGEYY